MTVSGKLYLVNLFQFNMLYSLLIPPPQYYILISQQLINRSVSYFCLNNTTTFAECISFFSYTVLFRWNNFLKVLEIFMKEMYSSFFFTNFLVFAGHFAFFFLINFLFLLYIKKIANKKIKEAKNI